MLLKNWEISMGNRKFVLIYNTFLISDVDFFLIFPYWDTPVIQARITYVSCHFDVCLQKDIQQCCDILTLRFIFLPEQ